MSIQGKEYHKAWREKNKDKIKMYYSRYMDKHGEELRLKRRTIEGRKRISISNKKQRDKNPERTKELMKAWYEKNKHTLEYKVKARANSRKHYHKNLEHSRKLSRIKGKRLMPQSLARAARYRRENIQFALKDRIRASINRALRRCGVMKSKRTMEMVGCSLEELKRHIESQFTNGMSWARRKEFHIDHHVPISAFDLTKAKDRDVAFNWKNLRPLPCLENNIKSDTVPNPLPDWIPVHISAKINNQRLAASAALNSSSALNSPTGLSCPCPPAFSGSVSS